MRASSVQFHFLFIIVTCGLFCIFFKIIFILGAHKMDRALYRSIKASCSFFIQFILKNAGKYVRFANMQKLVYTGFMFPFVFALKADKFRFAVNGIRTVCGRHSTGLQSHPHIRAFGSRIIRRARVYETLCPKFSTPYSLVRLLSHLDHALLTKE